LWYVEARLHRAFSIPVQMPFQTFDTVRGSMRAADNNMDEDQMLRATFQLVGLLEFDYMEKITRSGSDIVALEPTRTLSVLSQRIGESVETWNKAWKVLEDVDSKGGNLAAAQLNVLIAALRELPTDAALPASLGFKKHMDKVRMHLPSPVNRIHAGELL
jgi:hypothetical protein